MANQGGAATAGASVAGGGSGASGFDVRPADADADQQVAPFVSQVPGTPVNFPTYHGRPISWTAVSIVMVAFVIGGLALIFGPTWWLFWAALGLAAVGMLLAMGCHIFDDWY